LGRWDANCWCKIMWHYTYCLPPLIKGVNVLAKIILLNMFCRLHQIVFNLYMFFYVTCTFKCNISFSVSRYNHYMYVFLSIVASFSARCKCFREKVPTSQLRNPFSLLSKKILLPKINYISKRNKLIFRDVENDITI
jgi:hypothetical protein